MEFVEAIKDRQKIKEIKKILYARSKRDYLLFSIGINTGVKISDLLLIKKGEIVNSLNEANDFLLIDKQKFYLNMQVKKALQEYLPTVPYLKSDEYLFQSKKGLQPISRQQAYRIINSVAKDVRITSKIGTHTLRKTFGYHAYRSGVAVSLLQKIFHHSSKSETMKYIGLEKNEIVFPEIDVNL